jgi:hypothetical protein
MKSVKGVGGVPKIIAGNQPALTKVHRHAPEMKIGP